MESDLKSNKIALLVDYDNFNESNKLDILLNELDDLGEIIIGRVYFSNEEGKKLTETFQDLGLDPVYQLRYTKGKNAVDIKITMDAMELLSREYIDTFCLATNDSDFTPLVKKLREYNKNIIGAGTNKVSSHFKNSCNHFINVEKIEIGIEDKTMDKKGENTKITNDISDLVKLINDIINQNSEVDGYVYLSKVSEQLYLKDKEFNPKNYGASNSKVLNFFKQYLDKYYTLKETEHGWKVRISSKRLDNLKTRKVSSNKNKEKPIETEISVVDNKKDVISKVDVKMLEKATSIVKSEFKNTTKVNIQQLQHKINKNISDFTLKKIGYTKYKSYIQSLGYNLNGNFIVLKQDKRDRK